MNKTMTNEFPYKYTAQIIDERTDEVIVSTWAYSQEGLEEDMGKSGWVFAITRHEAKIAQEEADAKEEAERLKAEEVLDK